MEDKNLSARAIGRTFCQWADDSTQFRMFVVTDDQLTTSTIRHHHPLLRIININTSFNLLNLIVVSYC